jgi:hypothetical protein
VSGEQIGICFGDGRNKLGGENIPRLRTLRRTMQVPINQLLVDCYFDSESAELVHEEVLFEVSQDTGLIHRIRSLQDVPVLDEGAIDLRGLTVLPGFVDTHVHREQPFLDISLSLLKKKNI